MTQGTRDIGEILWIFQVFLVDVAIGFVWFGLGKKTRLVEMSERRSVYDGKERFSD